MLAGVPEYAGECRYVRGFPVGIIVDSPDLRDFCGLQGGHKNEMEHCRDRAERPLSCWQAWELGAASRAERGVIGYGLAGWRDRDVHRLVDAGDRGGNDFAERLA